MPRICRCLLLRTAAAAALCCLAALPAFAQPEAADGEEPWRVEARKRIAETRMGDLVVRVVDAAGKPAAGHPVRIAMTRHAFPWGTCVPAGRLTGEGPENETYRRHLRDLFNCAVLENDLKWNAWHGAYGPSFSRENTRAALVWLKDNGFRVRGHTMVWPDWQYLLPEGEALAADPAALQRRILEHVDDLAAFTKDFVYEWDVVNEPAHFDAVTRVLGPDAMKEWFVRARAALPPSCRLFVNEYNVVEPGEPGIPEKYAQIISGLLAAGAPLEGIGFQSHFQFVRANLEGVLKTFDTFARFGLPIVVTEFDANIADETVQAAFTRDFMTAAFSHPACQGFVFWGFWEGAHWRPQSALFRKDWTEKPNLAAYRDLVFREWWTDVEGVTDTNGELIVRGFKGAYRIHLGAQEQETAIGDTPARVEVTLGTHEK